jgi:hypothetical protein
MAAVSPWFATTRMLSEIRTLRARMETPRPSQSGAAAEHVRSPTPERPSAAR